MSRRRNCTFAILKRRWVHTQRQLFDHAYAQFGAATRTGAYVICLRALANYPHNIYLAALNLGPTVIELERMKRFADSLRNEHLSALFSNQPPETRSHVLTGKQQAGRYLQKDKIHCLLDVLPGSGSIGI